ncbi:hypothetical protein CBM2604_B40247 [Cupriavidus taiwanensis]|nr:hypothetical protein CBM2604_B40247 [Cupriavidus taiwanensis]SOZ48165.1 hypothetical protein CBM2610_B30247 [Cupriavidus taiwanensis]
MATRRCDASPVKRLQMIPARFDLIRGNGPAAIVEAGWVCDRHERNTQVSANVTGVSFKLFPQQPDALGLVLH